MIDVSSAALSALASASPLAYPLVFAAGAVTSIGPCVAPRYLAVVALASGTARPWRTVAWFTSGLVCGYVALGLVAGALIAIAGASRLTYGALSAGLAIGGLVTLFGGRDLCSCHDRSRRRPTSAGGAFLLGASGTLVVSPCCTPLVAAIASLTIFAGHTREGTLLLGTFALGHVVPLPLCAALGSRFGTVLARITVPHAPAIVAGTLMLALSAYYGLLA